MSAFAYVAPSARIADVCEASGEVFLMPRPSFRLPLGVKITGCTIDGLAVCGRGSIGADCIHVCTEPKGSRCPDCSSVGLM